MDDRRIGLVIRALRRRRGWRQVDLAVAAGVSQPSISLVERGHVDTFSIRTLRRILLALEARGDLDVRWRGGALDRTIDEGHADLVTLAVRSLANLGWDHAVEVTYAIFGERGSIDLLGFHRATASLLVIEVKTELTSVEETLRRLDQKVRLAGQIGQERFGSAVAGTSSLLVMPDSAAARRQVMRHREVLDAVFPAGNVAIRHWLAEPSGLIHGRWFLANMSHRSVARMLGGPGRVIRPKQARIRASSSTNGANSGRRPAVDEPKTG
jgi:transcriptional regulator with XRE-family HTH domain